MLALWVKVRVKDQERERFLKPIEADAIGSEPRSQVACASMLSELQQRGGQSRQILHRQTAMTLISWPQRVRS
jgi:hypothetical protein